MTNNFKTKLRHRRYPKNQLSRVYRYIEKYQAKHGYPPSTVDIAKFFSSSITVVRLSWLPRMEEARMLTRGPRGVPRSIKLLPLQETTQEVQ